MISPHTPPGTKVVYFQPATTSWPDKKIRLGDVLTITAIVQSSVAISGYAASVEESSARFDLRLLRRLDLPECLTSLLNVTPVDGDMVASKAGRQHLLPLLLASSSPYEQPLAGGSTLPEPPAFSQFV